MAIADLMRRGWHMMPDRVTVVFLNQVSPGVYTTANVHNCWRRGRGLAEAENSQGVYVMLSADWYIPKESHPGQPTPGDVIRFAAGSSAPHAAMSGDYIIIPDGVTEVGAMGAWKCATAMWSLQGGLTDTVTIYRPSVAIGPGGRAIHSGAPAVLSAAAPAKIQVVDTFALTPITASELAGKLVIPNPARVYLTTSVRVQPHDYMVDQHGLRWTVRNEYFVNLLGALQAIDVERVL